MICPHCQASLLRKERKGTVCSACGRPFALKNGN
jgi:predicted amidophosphoribosyltransferase